MRREQGYFLYRIAAGHALGSDVGLLVQGGPLAVLVQHQRVHVDELSVEFADGVVRTLKNMHLHLANVIDRTRLHHTQRLNPDPTAA